MKRIKEIIGVLSLVILISSCEYFGEFYFIIHNNTDNTLYISYTEQLWCPEDAFPTYEHGDDYEAIRLAKSDSTLIVESGETVKIDYGVGFVDKDFPDDNDIPECYGIVPLWDRIAYIIKASDTLDHSIFKKEKWIRNGSKYTLEISD